MRTKLDQQRMLREFVDANFVVVGLQAARQGADLYLSALMIAGYCRYSARTR
ncbi:MAG TPA: hypothetical protein VNJ03_17460 [Vicinamibacterales bacterium]|nr:hypothetical protein [Vicinamibacterales bacterium]